MKRVLKKIKPTRRKSFGIAAAASLLVGTLWLISYHSILGNLENKALKYGKSHANYVRGEMEDELEHIQSLIQKVADKLDSGRLTRATLPAFMKNELLKHGNMNGMGAGYKPSTKNDKYSPAYARNLKGEIKRSNAHDSYDYTDSDNKSARWYTQTLRAGDSHWMEPYFSDLDGIMVTRISVPFYRPGKKKIYENIAGVVYAQISLDFLAEFSRQMNLGEEGYNFVVSGNKKFIAHPDHLFLGKDYAEGGKNLNKKRENKIGKPLLGRSIYNKASDELRDLPAWLFYDAIAETGWSMGTVVYQDIFAPKGNIRVRNLIKIITTFVCFGIFLVLYFVSKEVRSANSLWASSVAISAILLIGIGSVWWAYRTHPLLHGHGDIIVASHAKLQRIETELNNSLKRRNLEEPLKIPTGLLIKSLKFTDINETTVAGFIWQKYPLDMPKGMEQGIVFVDALDPEGVAIDEVYRIKEKDHEVVGWNFRVILRDSFNLSKYPLDHEFVQIEIWPKSVGRGVWLAPDIDDYEFLAPLKKPGLAANIHLENWNFSHSFFSFEFDSYNANFGNRRTAQHREMIPSMFFNIGVQRVMVSSLVAHGIPILVVACFLYCVLLISSENAFSVMSYLAALFFVLVISHVGLRSELGVNSLVYGEAFYLVMYLIMLMICADAMMQESKWEFKVLSYHNNLFPKLAYWPFLSGVAFIITAFTFYPSL